TTKPPYQPAQDPPNHPDRLVRFVRGAQVPTSPLPHARWTHLSAQSMDQNILHQEKPPSVKSPIGLPPCLPAWIEPPHRMEQSTLWSTTSDQQRTSTPPAHHLPPSPGENRAPQCAN